MIEKMFLKRSEASEYFQKKYNLLSTPLAKLVIITSVGNLDMLAWKVNINNKPHYSFTKGEDSQLDIKPNLLKILEIVGKNYTKFFLLNNEVYLIKKIKTTNQNAINLSCTADRTFCRAKEILLGDNIKEATNFEPQLFAIQNQARLMIGLVWKTPDSYYQVFQNSPIIINSSFRLRAIEENETFYIGKKKYFLGKCKGKPCIYKTN